jgi:hypothetical protein
MVCGLVSDWNAMQRTFTVASLNFRHQFESTFQGSADIYAHTNTA